MSAEENKAVVRRMIEEVWNDHDFTNFEEVVAENHFDHMAHVLPRPQLMQ